jgi:hypothetical protein
MSMPRGNAPSKIDANQPAIVAALRQCGYYVLDLHTLGHGVPDLMVVSNTDRSRALLLEVKGRAGTLTTDEKAFRLSYAGRMCVVRSPEEAIEIMQIFDTESNDD